MKELTPPPQDFSAATVDTLFEYLEASNSGRRIGLNTIEIDLTPRSILRANTQPPQLKRKVGLGKNGLDFSWCYEKEADLTPEARDIKHRSEHLRHQLKQERKILLAQEQKNEKEQ